MEFVFQDWSYIHIFFLFRITILPQGSLRILNASKSDEGRYSCQGVNVFGSAEIVASVSVKGMKKYVNVIDDFPLLMFLYCLQSPAKHATLYKQNKRPFKTKYQVNFSLIKLCMKLHSSAFKF